MMEYTMKLIFSKKADMAVMEERIKDICQRSGSVILEVKDNTIIYGAEGYEQFGPAFIHLRFEDEIKYQIDDAIWSDPDDKPHSCKKNLLRNVIRFSKAKELGIAVDLFVRKNKDDNVAKSFYYLGRMTMDHSVPVKMQGTGDNAVEMFWNLDVGVREDIYDYITSEDA